MRRHFPTVGFSGSDFLAIPSLMIMLSIRILRYLRRETGTTYVSLHALYALDLPHTASVCPNLRYGYLIYLFILYEVKPHSEYNTMSSANHSSIV